MTFSLIAWLWILSFLLVVPLNLSTIWLVIYLSFLDNTRDDRIYCSKSRLYSRTFKVWFSRSQKDLRILCIEWAYPKLQSKLHLWFDELATIKLVPRIRGNSATGKQRLYSWSRALQLAIWAWNQPRRILLKKNLILIEHFCISRMMPNSP